MGLSCDGCGTTFSSCDDVYCEDCSKEMNCEHCGCDISSDDEVYCDDCHNTSFKKLGFSEADAFMELVEKLQKIAENGKPFSLDHVNKINDFAAEFIKEL